MSEHRESESSTPGVADENIRRLLSRSYEPEVPDAARIQRVEAKMYAALSAPTVYRMGPSWRVHVSWGAVAAVLLVGIGILLFSGDPQRPPVSAGPGAGGPEPRSGMMLAGLTPRERGEAPAAQTLAVGQSIQTGATERRRVVLADGSVLYVNQNTTAKIEGERRVAVTSGEVYVEVSPRGPGEPLFSVRTPTRTVSALGTRFDVQVGDQGTRVLVTQGKVQVTGLKDPVVSGQQLEPEQAKVEKSIVPAPRASKALDWTRELMAAAESPLVPDSEYQGGAIVVVDPYGQQARLSLRKYHVDVHIQDGFARTTIDQTYFNHEHSRQEGTFYFPLPADASLSRLAMYVEGRLMEGGMAERDYARGVYEQILYTRRDPALLEWMDGSTFKMRVFPLEPRQEKRIIISYIQKLPEAYGRGLYRFPAGHNLELVRDWSFHATVKNAFGTHWSSDSHALMASHVGDDLMLDVAGRHVKPDKDVVIRLHNSERATSLAGQGRFSMARHDGARYLMLRFRPNLPSEPVRQRRDWVILFETAGNRDPLLARVQVDVVKTILENAEHDDTFNIVMASTRTAVYASAPQRATPENVKAAVAYLEKAHLVGALDLGRALAAAEPLVQAAQNPYLVHVGAGVSALGERREDALAQRVPQRARYVGVGVGKQWSRAFMKSAAARTGGYFTQINPDEQITWRAFDLVATLNTPRLLDIKVTDPAGQAAFLTFDDSIAQGEEVAAVARLDAAAPDPRQVMVTGTLNGQPYRRSIPVENIEGGADYLPRAWARLEIDRLLDADANGNKAKIIELSKAMYVMSPFTSLLVLEDEKMYEQFKVDRGRKDHWAMYPAPEKISVVYEPDPNMPGAAPRVDATTQGVKPSAEQILQTILVRVPPGVLRWANEPYYYGGRGLTALQIANGMHMAAADFEDDFGFEDRLGGLGGRGGGRFWERNDGATRMNQWFDRNELLVEGLSAVTGAAKPASPMPALRPMNGPAAMPMDRLSAISGPVSAASAITRTRRSAGLEFAEHAKRLELKRDMGDQFEGWAFSESELRLRDLSLAERFASSLRFRVDRKDNLPMQDFFAVSDLALKRRYPARGGIVNLLYQRPQFSGDWRFFGDLMSFAPGMNTSSADIRAVLEAEAAADPAAAPGTIDPAARKLIEQARNTGWQSVRIDPDGPQPAFTITFDGSGRYAYERSVSEGLRERVYCDGKTLWHLYPELGIGAKRSVSRFHRAELASLVPWYLPSAEDLARGHDLLLVDQRTVALEPRPTAPTTQPTTRPVHQRVHLVFDEQARLAERQLVEMPSGKVLYRMIQSLDGIVRTLDADGKEIDRRDLALKDAQFVNVTPDTSALVVLPLPLRTRQHVEQKHPPVPNSPYDWGEEGTLAMIGADLSGNGHTVMQTIAHRYFSKGDRRIGFYTLLLSSGLHWEPANTRPQVNHVAVSFNPVADHPDSALARYIVEQLDFQRRGYGADVNAPVAGGSRFIDRLAGFRQIYARFVSGRANQGNEADRHAERQRAFEFIRACKDPFVGWALLSLIHNYGGHAGFYEQLAEAAKSFQDVSGLGYAARYEYASALCSSGKYDEARRVFAELYSQALDKGILPPIDYQFRNAFQSNATEAQRDQYTALLRKASAILCEKVGRHAGVYLAWQCHQLGDQPIAEDLFGMAMLDVPESQRLMTHLAAINFLWHTGQAPRADALIEPLLADPRFGKYPELWRLGSAIASARGMLARSLARLERAVELDYQDLPAVLNIQMVRRDYGQLLGQYQQLADAIATLENDPPRDLMAKVVRYADRWRALDPDDTAACQAAARILQRFEARDMAWDYLTTPLADRPNESAGWVNLASSLRQQGDWQLADRAYETAFEVEPTNAQILWDRAQLLQQSQRLEEARQLYRRLAEGPWQPRFNWIQSQAKRYIGAQ